MLWEFTESRCALFQKCVCARVRACVRVCVCVCVGGGGEFKEELILELGLEEWVILGQVVVGSGWLILQAHRRNEKEAI